MPTACAELPREPIERRPHGSGTELSLWVVLRLRRRVWGRCGATAYRGVLVIPLRVTRVTQSTPHAHAHRTPHTPSCEGLPRGNPVRWKSTSRGRAVILLVHSPLLGQALLPALPPLSDMLKFSGSLRARQVTPKPEGQPGGGPATAHGAASRIRRSEPRSDIVRVPLAPPPSPHCGGPTIAAIGRRHTFTGREARGARAVAPRGRRRVPHPSPLRPHRGRSPPHGGSPRWARCCGSIERTTSTDWPFESGRPAACCLAVSFLPQNLLGGEGCGWGLRSSQPPRRTALVAPSWGSSMPAPGTSRGSVHGSVRGALATQLKGSRRSLRRLDSGSLPD